MKPLVTIVSFTLIVMISGCTTVIPKMAPKVDSETAIGDDFNFRSHFVNVHGSEIHYVDEGEGETLVLVHGNPTSSYLWRNIIPALSEEYRVIAIDLVGMGKSEKPDIDYTLQDHIHYFNAFIDALELKDINLVLHDWGGAIGLNYLKENPQNVNRIVLMEAVTKPMSWKDADMVSEFLFKRLRGEKSGEKLIVENNYFVEKLLPMMSGRKLTDVEMDYYRSPYITEGSRKPVRVWPQEIPIDGTPERNYKLVSENYEYLKKSGKPILFLHGKPGLIYSKKMIATLKTHFPDASFKSVGPGLHYLQETQPSSISNEILTWVATN